MLRRAWLQHMDCSILEYPAVLTSKVHYIWVNSDNSQLSRPNLYQALGSICPAPNLFGLISSSFPPSLGSRNTDVTAPPTLQAPSCLSAFALAVPSIWTTLPSHGCSQASSESLFKYRLLIRTSLSTLFNSAKSPHLGPLIPPSLLYFPPKCLSFSNLSWEKSYLFITFIFYLPQRECIPCRSDTFFLFCSLECPQP